MFDVMGIYQHHDAVTGTAKQFVADDYSARYVKAQKQSLKTYSKLIGERV